MGSVERVTSGALRHVRPWHGAFAYTPQGGATTTVTPNLPEAPTRPLGALRLTVETLAFGDAPAVTIRIDTP